MRFDPSFRPRLRPVEPFRVPGEEGQIGVRDRSGISQVVLTLSPAALHLIALMDGTNTLDQIRSEFQKQFGQLVADETLQGIVGNLEQSLLLEGETFDSTYRQLLLDYRGKNLRTMDHADDLGVTRGGETFHAMLGLVEGNGPPQPVPIRGLIAPHLDYARGAPCYGLAYAAILYRKPPQRVIILGTNHCGRSTGVVATGCDFHTPLGITRCDREFLQSLEAHCGDLRTYELDHKNEHSVELQVAWLQFLYGAQNFSIVPFLCPDPCGATGTAPLDGKGVDLKDFSEALSQLIADDPADTLLVAGADFSHVGSSFGDHRNLDDSFLEEVRKADRRALDYLELGDPAGFVQCIAREDNPTRICSAGCMFVLVAALPRARGQVVRYHQAVDREAQVCVTCAAVVFA